MKNTTNDRWTHERLADALARELGACESPGFTRHLLRELGARMLHDALASEPEPRTLLELWSVVVERCLREGEAARILQVSLHEAASREPELSIRDYAARTGTRLRSA